MSFKEVIEQTTKAAAEQSTVNEGDYIGADGLLYCGKCNTRKQGEYSFPWGVVRPYHLCKCAEKARDKAAEEWKRAQRMVDERERLSVLRNNGLLEASISEICQMICPEAKKEAERICFPISNMRSWTFENDDMKNPKITSALKNYVENFPEFRKQGQGLLLFGEVGTGKSYIAAAAANALFDKGYSVLLTDFERIEKTVFGLEDKQAYYDSLNKFDLLMLDDLAAERNTSYMQSIVYNVINSRAAAGLPMIITTNLTSDELKKPQEISDKRIFDRVLASCLPVEVTGENRRHKKLAENAGELRAKLGL